MLWCCVAALVFLLGNIGLQTSSSVTAYVNIRLVQGEKVDTMFLLRKYTSHCIVQVILLASLMGIISTFWYDRRVVLTS